MEQIHSVLSHKIQDNNSVLMWVFGLLRCSEFTVPSINGYDPTVHLSLQDIATDSHTAPTLIRLNIKQFKTDLFRKGIQLFLGKTNHCVCPVKAILPYLASRGSNPGPLFMTHNNSPLTRQFFSTSLSAILSAADLDHRKYNTHSFRIWAATSAKLAGASELYIKMLGRWRSNAFEHYIRTPSEHLASLSRQLVSSISSS